MSKDYATEGNLKGTCALVNKTTIKIAVVLALLAGGFYWHVQDKQEAVQQAVYVARDDLIKRYDKSLKEAQESALRASNALQAQADRDRQERDDKINQISADLNVALIELRKRPSRPDYVAQDTGTSQACTARELYLEDAEFLAREAARAEAVRVERDYYYQSYEEVRKKQNGTP
jgi:hypothetical protein